MTSAERTEAIRYAKCMLLDAQTAKRSHGEPHNPFTPRLGHEAEFENAQRRIAQAKKLLKLLEPSPVVSKRRKTLGTLKAILLVAAFNSGLWIYSVSTTITEPLARILAVGTALSLVGVSAFCGVRLALSSYRKRK